jgi:hypothetical protein
MKKLLLLALYNLFTIVIFAQPTLKGFKWQAVLRKDSELVRVGIFDVHVAVIRDTSGDGDGPVIYAEDHFDITVSDFGQLSVNVGRGEAMPEMTTTSFADIPWDEYDFYFQAVISRDGEDIVFDKSPILIPPFWEGGQSLWEASGDSLLQSGQRNVDIQGDLEVEGHFQWHSGKNFFLIPGSGNVESEFSLDFPDADGNKRWSVWDPEHRHILVVRNNNRVGIGTIHPLSTLDIIDGGVGHNGVLVRNSLPGTATRIDDFGIDVGILDNFGILNDKISLRYAGNSSSGYGIILTRGENNRQNVNISTNSSNQNEGLICTSDEDGNAQACLFVQNGLGILTADVKNFSIDHPSDEKKEIWYACIEGPEAGAYDRGTATLENGEVFVEFSDHFQIVANHETMTVHLTPLFAETYGLAVIEKSAKGFKVKELKSGRGNFSFDWEVKCKRKGYENYRVVREKSLP